MRYIIPATVSLLASALTVNAQTEADPVTYYGFGNWEGSAYFHQPSGHFSHCAIIASYVSGDQLLFSVTQGATVVVGILREGGFVANRPIPVSLYVDRRAPFHATLTGNSSDFAVLEIPQLEQALDAFRRGYNLAIVGPGIRGDYSLDGTFRALEMTLDCALANYKRTFVPSPSAPPPTSPPKVSGIDRTLLFQVATNVISTIGVSDSRFFTTAEISELGFPSEAVFWVSEEQGVSGGTLILPQEGDLSASDPGDTSFLAGLCGGGDFASSARKISHETNEVRELRVLCDKDGSRTEGFLTKTWFGTSVLYNFLLFKEAENELTSSERREQSEMVGLYAASLTTD